MKPGDLVQVKQLDHGWPRGGDGPQGVPSTDPEPMIFWIYATVLEVLEDGAMVEVAHPANREHGARKKVLRADLRTAEDVLALHDAHPQKHVEKLDFQRAEHKELNNLRVAIDRLTPAAVKE
jgi:hypothetical protein